MRINFYKLTTNAAMIGVVTIASLKAYATEPTCRDLFAGPRLSQLRLEETIKNSLAAELEKHETPPGRIALWMIKKSIQKKMAEECADGCTEQDGARIVETSIINSLEKVDELKLQAKQIRGYAILAGVSIGIAVTGHFAKGSVPVNEQWLNDFITVATPVVLYKLGAPLWDHMGSIFYRGAFRVRDGKSFLRDGSEMGHYRERNFILKEKMTQQEQEETSRIFSLLNMIDSTFNSALEGILSSDPSKGGIPRAAARLATVAMKIRKFYPEVSPGPDDADVVRTINMIFTQFLPKNDTRQALYDAVIEQLKKNDPAFADTQTASVYKKAVADWVGISPAP